MFGHKLFSVYLWYEKLMFKYGAMNESIGLYRHRCHRYCINITCVKPRKTHTHKKPSHTQTLTNEQKTNTISLNVYLFMVITHLIFYDFYVIFLNLILG